MKKNYQKKLQGLRFDEQSLILLVFYLGQQIFQHIHNLFSGDIPCRIFIGK